MSEVIECPQCGGGGEILNMEPDVPWYFTRCSRCAGTGTILERDGDGAETGGEDDSHDYPGVI